MKFKLTLFAVLFTALAIPQTVKAYDFSAMSPSGHTLYYWIIGNNTVKVAGKSDTNYSTNASGQGNLTIPGTVTYSGRIYNVTKICRWSFNGSSITSVTIPNSITSIGERAFNNCTGLTSVVFNADSCTSTGTNYYAFYGCSNINSFVFGNNVKVIPAHLCGGMNRLTSISIPDSVTSIGSYAFSGCTGLTSIFIPNSVTSIESYAFSGCTGLTSVTIPYFVTSIGNSAFNNCTGLTSVVFNADSCTSAGSYYSAFSGCSNINHFVFGNNVKVIPAYVCYNMNSLTSVTIPDSVTSINLYAFYGCTGLTSVIIPNTVTSINYGAFQSCTGLTSITIPNSVTSIGERAFSHCTGLTSVVFNADSCTYAEEIIFNNINNRAFYGCSNINSFVFGNNVKIIPTGLCYFMDRLTSVTIPNSVTSIGERAFYNCTGLTSVVFNADSCTSVGLPYHAFDGCSNITNFTFGNNVKVIPDSLCYGMNRLTSVVFNADSCISAGSSLNSRAFYGCSNITNFTFGNNVKVIPAYLCYGMNRLTSVTIPNSVTTVGDYAFSGCSGLTGLLPAGLASIGNFAFSGCSGLTGPISFSEGLTSIGYESFSGCRGLTSVTIPNSVVSLGGYAFAGCSSLSTVLIGNSVMDIGFYAFNQCSSLKSVVFSADSCVSAINAFVYCDSLTNIVFTNNVKCIPERLFGNDNFPFNLSLTSVTIGSSVVRIAADAFYNCRALDTVFLLPHTPPTLLGGNNCFGTSPHFFIHCGDYTNYTTAGGFWSNGNYVRYYYPNFNINLSSSNTLQGSVSSVLQEGHVVSCDSTTIIRATASQGYHFSHWNDDSTANPRTVTLTQDTSFIAYFDRNTYYVNGTSSQAARGYVTGSDTVYYLDTVILTATANYGYHFQRWNDNNTDNPRAIVATGNITKSAVFAPNQYTITLNVDNTTHGTCTGAGSYNYLSSRSIRANASQGYHFVQWSDGETSNPRTISLTQDTAFTAQFARNQYTVTGASNNVSRGSVYGSDTVYYLDSVTLTATANYGYHFSRWSDNNTDNPRIVVATGNINLTAIFDYNQYTITVNADTSTHGTCTGGGSYNYLSARAIQANANYGYHFTQWSDGDTNNPRSIILTQDTSFTAYFGRNNYQVSVLSANDTMGSVAGSALVLYLDSITITATANYGYHFLRWNDNNTDNPRTVVATGNINLTAVFDYNQYTIVVNADTSTHGTCTGGGSFNYLSSHAIQANANYGYHFTQWSDGDTNNPRSITLTQDTSFTAYFGRNNYQISVLSDNDTMGGATGSASALYLDSITISATANYGYLFSHWNDSVTTTPRTIQVTEDKVYTAYFSYDQFSLAVQSNNPTQGLVSGAGRYNYLSNRTITATANYGYHFIYWNDGVTENPRSITLTQDSSFTAYFAPNQYTLTVNASEHGTASGSGTYSFGDTITIQASPEAHYHFVRWNDGNLDNPRQYVVEADITLTAFFAIDTHTVNVAANDIARGRVETSGTAFTYGTPCTVSATAYTGYTFVGWSNGMTANSYTFAVLEDVSLTAIFLSPDEMVTVTAESGNPSMGTATVNGTNAVTVMPGEEVTLTATPFSGYRFLRWQDDNTLATRTVTATNNITYTAYFERNVGIDDVKTIDAKIYARDGQIVVEGAEGMPVVLYDAVGRQLTARREEAHGGTPLRFDVPTSGVYLVKVGDCPARRIVMLR